MCDQVDSIYRALVFIEEQLQNSLTLPPCAQASGYSLFHFIRLFNRMTHHTPYDYIMRRRLSEAARRLRTNSRRITDIALDYGFENLESFSRAFKRMFGMQPSHWREKKPATERAGIPALKREDLLFRSGARFQAPVLIDIEAIKLRGLMAALVPEVSARVEQRRQTAMNVLAICGIKEPAQMTACTFPVDPQRNVRHVFVGLAANDEVQKNPRLADYQLPAARYARMNIDESDKDCALRYLYCTWLPRHGFKPAGQLEVEQFQLDEKVEAVLVPALPVTEE